MIEEIYKKCGAYLKGHFLLSSGHHSEFYLQSAKVLEDPKRAEALTKILADIINKNNIKAEVICAPAIGGLLAGYELARALNCRFIFTERVNGEMTLKRGFEVKKGEKFIICEDIITTGGSALESANLIKNLGGEIVAFASLANRGFCTSTNLRNPKKGDARLPLDIPFFTIGNFNFEIYNPQNCPLCKNGDKATKPGSNVIHG